MSLESVTQGFPIDPYLLPARQAGAPRRSSWVDGRERALVFFWETAGTSNVYLIRTQAPFVTRIIQRAFGAEPDGKFGELTRRAITTHARANGVNVPDSWPVTAPLCAYALVMGFFGGRGGRVSFPARIEYPDINHPVLPSNPQGVEYTYISALDVATGREVTLSVGPDGLIQPPTPTQPTAPTAPTSTTTINNFFEGDRGNGNMGLGNMGLGHMGLGTLASLLPPMNGGAFMAFDPAKPDSILAFPREVLGQTPCPKEYIDENGVCKLRGTLYIGGRVLQPIDGTSNIVVDWADPATYKTADKTPGVIAGGLLMALASLIGVGTVDAPLLKANGRRSRAWKW